MRWTLAAFLALACACDGPASGLPDGGGGGGGDGDADIDPGADGGTSNPRTIRLTLRNRPNNAAPYSFFVAYQDGSAPWQTAPAPSGDTYAFEVSAPSYGVAFGCIGNVAGTGTTQLRTVTTAHFAVGERTEVAFDVPARCSDRNPPTVTLSGTVINRPFGGFLVVQYGSRQAFVAPQSGNFSLQTPPGTHDLVVAHAVSQGNGEYYVDETVVIRDLALTGSASHTIDFNAARSTSAYPVTVAIPNARVVATTTLYTANGTALDVVRLASDWRTLSLAPGQMRSTDVYDQAIAVSAPGQGVTITNATSTPGAQTFTLPPLLGDVSAAVTAKTPYPIVTATWPAYSGAIGYAWNAMQQPSAQQCGGNVPCTIVWTAYLSPGVSGAMPGYEMPDLADVAGWRSAFALVPNAQIVGNVIAQTSSAGAGDFPPGVPASGTQRVFVRSDYGVMP